jgi:hypothetical protein
MNMEKMPVRPGSQQVNRSRELPETRWTSRLKGDVVFMGAVIPDLQKKATVYILVKNGYF